MDGGKWHHGHLVLPLLLQAGYPPVFLELGILIFYYTRGGGGYITSDVLVVWTELEQTEG